MNKQDLVKLVSEKTGISKEAAGQAQKTVIEAIASALEKGDFSFPHRVWEFQSGRPLSPRRSKPEHRRKNADPGVQSC